MESNESINTNIFLYLFLPLSSSLSLALATLASWRFNSPLRSGPMRGNPSARSPGGQDGLDHVHVPDRVLDRRRDGGVVEDRPGEEVALDGVLVAGLDLDSLDRPGVPLDSEGTGGVVRGIERDLGKLDPPLGPDH